MGPKTAHSTWGDAESMPCKLTLMWICKDKKMLRFEKHDEKLFLKVDNFYKTVPPTVIF